MEPIKNDTEEKLEPTAKFQLTIGYKYQEMDDEMIIYDLLSDRTFQLNQTGKYIWDRLAKELSLQEVANQFSKDFKIDNQQALDVCSGFAREIYSCRLLSKHAGT